MDVEIPISALPLIAPTLASILPFVEGGLTGQNTLAALLGLASLTPGGTPGQIQYNNAGALGGLGSYDGSMLTLPMPVVLGNATPPVVSAPNASSYYLPALTIAADANSFPGYIGTIRHFVAGSGSMAGNGAFYDVFASRGTLASPLPSQAGDYLFAIDAFGRSGSSYKYGSQLVMNSTAAAVGDGPVPSNFFFGWSVPSTELREGVEFITLNDHATIVLTSYPNQVSMQVTANNEVSFRNGKPDSAYANIIGNSLVVADDAYDASAWNGSLAVPTKNAIRDKFESLTYGFGDFVGPASSTDNAIVRFDGTTGKLGQNSLVTVDDSGNFFLPASTKLDFASGNVTLTHASGALKIAANQFLVGTYTTSIGFGAQFIYASGVTPQQTFFIQDGTPSTGKTKVVIRGGPADADGVDTDRALEIQKNDQTPVIWLRQDGALVAKSLVAADSPIFSWILWDSTVHATIVPGLNLAASPLVGWSSTTHSYDAKDVAIGRNAARVLEINNGTPGTYGDLVARNISTTGYVDAASFKLAGVAFTPVVTTRTINTTAPLTGGGDLSADRTFAMTAATTSMDGYLKAVDWTTFNAKVTANGAIAGATKTKITFDSKGLVTAGADATTADIADSTNKRYVTDAELIVILNTSGVNTGDQTLAGLGGAPLTRNINTTAPLTGGGDLSADRTLAVSSATTSAVGVAELATDGENAANVVVQGNDSRLKIHRMFLAMAA